MVSWFQVRRWVSIIGCRQRWYCGRYKRKSQLIISGSPLGHWSVWNHVRVLLNCHLMPTFCVLVTWRMIFLYQLPMQKRPVRPHLPIVLWHSNYYLAMCWSPPWEIVFARHTPIQIFRHAYIRVMHGCGCVSMKPQRHGRYCCPRRLLNPKSRVWRSV